MTLGPLQARRAQRRTPMTARWLVQESLTARGAALIIAGFTLVMTLAGGILARVLDHTDFRTLGSALWWSLQTVTTVGYGDIVPRQTSGRLIGAIVMLVGLGFLAVTTASVTAALVEHARRRLARNVEPEVAAALDSIQDQLASIEDAVKALSASKSDRDVL